MKAISLMTVLVLASCASKKKVDPVMDPLEARAGQFRQCYLESDSFSGKEKKSGKVKIDLRISSEGKAASAKVAQSDFKDPNFHACLLWLVKETKFPPQASGKFTDVKIPLKFHP